MSVSKFFKEAIAYRLGGGHLADHKAMNVPNLTFNVNGTIAGLQVAGLSTVPLASGEIISATSLGIFPNTGVDMQPALQAISDAAAGGNAGSNGIKLLLAKGTYLLNNTLTLGVQVALVGQGRVATVLKAGPTFPTNGKAVIAYPAVGSPQGVYVSDLQIDCNNVALTTGLSAGSAQEGCGASRILVQNFKAIGIDLTGGAANTAWNEIQLYGAASSQYGIKCYTTGGATTVFNKVSVIGLGGNANMTGGIYIQDCVVTGTGWHFEGTADGLAIGGNNSIIDVTGISANYVSGNVTTLVHLQGGAERCDIRAIQKAGATNSLKDDNIGLTSTDAFIYSTRALTSKQISSISVSPNGSPFQYMNISQNIRYVGISGGTVSLVEFSRDGATWFQLSTTTGVMALAAPYDRIRVTYSVAPSMTAFPMA